MNNKYIAKVLKIIEPYTVVINKGTNTGYKSGSKFIII